MKKHLQLIVIGMLVPFLMNAQWTSQATTFTTPLYGLLDISIAGPNTVWAAAYDATTGNSVPDFTKTTNGGNLFKRGLFTPSGYSASSIFALDDSTAWFAAYDNVSTGGSGIFKTTDGGLTWQEQGAGVVYNASSYLDNIYFWNANVGVAIGDPNPTEFEIYTTVDGGATWTPVPGTSIPDPLANEYGVAEHQCVIGDNIWFDTNKGRIYHSTDKGFTWSVSNTGIPTTDTTLIDIAYMNVNEGIARQYNFYTNNNDHVKRTIDGGATWTDVIYSGTFCGTSLAYVPGTVSTLMSTGFFLGGVGSSYSNDGGNTWAVIDTGVPNEKVRFLNSTTGWRGGYNSDSVTGGIFKYTGLPLGIQNTKSGKEIYFNAYPNPTHGSITVQLNNGESTNLSITVYDLQGRSILKNDYGNPGEFFLRTLDLSKLSAGAYLMRIENGSLSHAERVVIR